MSCFVFRMPPQDARSQVGAKPVGSKQRRRTKGPKAHDPGPAPERPTLAPEPPRFMQMEREIVAEFRPRMLAELSRRVEAQTEQLRREPPPICPKEGCGRTMHRRGSTPTTQCTLCGLLTIRADVFRCKSCKTRSRPLFDRLGIEPGRISGALARLIALLGVVAPYELAAQMVGLLLGLQVNAMGVWREVQRLGAAYETYDQALSLYHGDVRTPCPEPDRAPDVVLLEPDGAALGMQRPKRKKRSDAAQKAANEAEPKAANEAESKAAPQPSEFREVKTGVLMLPAERVETSPGRRSVLRRVLVTCLGDADLLFVRLWSAMCELGWSSGKTVVVIVGDGAEWIWNRASMFPRRCEILDFWHAVERAWEFARLHFGTGSKDAADWAHALATRLRAGEVFVVIAELRALRCERPEARELLDKLIVYYTTNASRMRYDEYLRLGYGIGSGAVESAHKQILQARLRQAGMRWSVRGATHLLALRVLLLNGRWSELDRLRRPSLAA